MILEMALLHQAELRSWAEEKPSGFGASKEYKPSFSLEEEACNHQCVAT
jgi:hypothetical protein